MNVNTNNHPTRIVEVGLESRSYQILVGHNLLAQAGALILPVLTAKRVVIVTDETVADLHLRILQKSLKTAGIATETLILPPGEKTKSFGFLEKLLNDLLDLQIQRDETLIAFGGGVVGDLTGFAAASLRRGVNFVQIPTTLLSQVDSSVGGKTGINTAHGKNLIGAFHQPRLVIADVGLLATLPRRQLLAGYAEVVKYGLLGDFDFFNWLESHGPALLDGDITDQIEAVERSVQAKARIVAEDEREGGVRALLNLGHTFGHALEAQTGYGADLVHGEAVAIGMIMAARLSERKGLIGGQDIERMRRHYEATGLPASLPRIKGVTWSAKRLHSHMYQDKKVSAGKLTFILLRALGDACITQDVIADDLMYILEEQCDASAN